jgi:hypothetical protein
LIGRSFDSNPPLTTTLTLISFSSTEISPSKSPEVARFPVTPTLAKVTSGKACSSFNDPSTASSFLLPSNWNFLKVLIGFLFYQIVS